MTSSIRGKNVDLIMGIPSYNEADNIAFVAHQLSVGAKKYFPNFSSMIINLDNNSPDNTQDAFLHADTGDIPKKYTSTEKGVVGKGNNLKNLFKEVSRLEPKAVVMVDADLKSITPEWVNTLAAPILAGHDYVTPIYSRNEYDGTITNNICYPLIYGLFQADIRQPIAGDVSFSSKMAKYWLDMEWKESTGQYGIDIFMTTTALLNGFKGCQVVLGSKVHKPSAPKLGPMFSQVVSTLFENISHFKEWWMAKKNMKPSLVFGECDYQEPQSLPTDYKDIKKKSIIGFVQMENIIAGILTPSLYQEMRKMYEKKRWNIGIGLWSEILYDFVYAYDKATDKDAVVEALKPLYFARAASFYRQTMELDHQDAEKKIKSQASQFQRRRSLLIKRFQEESEYENIAETTSQYLNTAVN